MQFNSSSETLVILLDTGAGPSLIKISKIPKNIEVDENQILELRGITQNSINTLGKIHLSFRELEFIFHVVPDDFPIREDGLLGSEMLRNFKANINYKERHVVMHNYRISFYNVEEENWNEQSQAGLARKNLCLQSDVSEEGDVIRDINYVETKFEDVKKEMNKVINSEIRDSRFEVRNLKEIEKHIGDEDNKAPKSEIQNDKGALKLVEKSSAAPQSEIRDSRFEICLIMMRI